MHELSLFHKDKLLSLVIARFQGSGEFEFIEQEVISAILYEKS